MVPDVAALVPCTAATVAALVPCTVAIVAALDTAALTLPSIYTQRDNCHETEKC